MFRLVAFVALLVSAAAFMPAMRSMNGRSALKMNYENEAGVVQPTGFFDPLGLSRNIDQQTFEDYRAAELKHGRVAMLAVLGYVVPEVFRFPGEIGKSSLCQLLLHFLSLISCPLLF